ncbi:MAG: CvpA family protein [Muribaculaceae bacterium]|nr:CvpA family protein [Muribaculaceae bacterium]
MFDLTILDYIYVGVILASTVWATIRGGIYETVATLSWVVAAVSARFISPFLDNLLQSWFGLSESTVGTLVASYFVVFFAILLIVGFINQKLRDKIQDSIMNVTDHTLGVIFGIIRGVVVMGFVYWGMLWYYSDTPGLPTWLADARTRPLMQLTAVKMDQWFIPGSENRLLKRDMAGTHEAMEIYNNLINPAVVDNGGSQHNNPDKVPTPDAPKSADNGNPPVKAQAPADTSSDEGVGYKSSERTALENQLLQIKTVATAIEQHEANRPNPPTDAE